MICLQTFTFVISIRRFSTEIKNYGRGILKRSEISLDILPNITLLQKNVVLIWIFCKSYPYIQFLRILCESLLVPVEITRNPIPNILFVHMTMKRNNIIHEMGILIEAASIISQYSNDDGHNFHANLALIWLLNILKIILDTCYSICSCFC